VLIPHYFALEPLKRVWAALPPAPVGATYQQESGTDIDRYRDALMPRMRKSPPDPSKRETDPESCPPSKVEKW
jgi:hypothetical protein